MQDRFVARQMALYFGMVKCIDDNIGRILDTLRRNGQIENTILVFTSDHGGTAWAMRHPERRPRENLLARDRAFFCSAFVRHVFAGAGVDLVSGIHEKNTAPEHIALTGVPHTKWLLVRGEVPASREFVKKVKARLKRRG